MKRKLDFKNQILIILIIIFSIIIIFPSLALFSKMKQIDKSKQLMTTNNNVSQLKNTMELILVEADRLLYQTLFDTAIENYPDYYETMSYAERKKINSKMMRITSANIYFSNCIVYYPEDKKIVDFEKDIMVSSEGYEDKAFLDDIYSKYKNDKFKEMNLYTTEQDGKTNIVLVKPISVMSYEPRGYLMMSLSPRFIGDILDSLIIEEQASFMIYDSVGHQVAGIGEEIEKAYIEEFLIREESPSSEEITIEGQKMLMVNAFSKRLDWHFTYMIPMEYVYQLSSMSGKFILIVTMIILILAIACAKLLSNLFYRPIHAIKDNLNIREQRDSNDIDNIVGNIKDMKADNQKLSDLVEKGKPMLKQMFLHKLMDEKHKAENIPERLKYYDINFNIEDVFCVGVLSIDTVEDKKYTEKQIVMLHIYIKENVASFFDQHDIKLEFLEKEGESLIVIFNFSKEKKKIFTQLLQEMYHDIFRNIKQSVTIGIGMGYVGTEKIGLSYKSALKAVQHKIFEGSDQVIYFENLQTTDHINLISAYELVETITTSIKHNSREDVVAQVSLYIDYVIENTRDLDNVKFSLNYLLTSVLKTMDDLGVNCEDIGFSRNKGYTTIYNMKSLEKVKSYFIAFLMALIDYIGNKQDNKSKEIYLKIREYIDLHFSDPNLSLDVISGELQFSISYLSKIFKDFEGTSIKPYILERRIEYSKELILNSDNKIKEIAEQVGYWNDRAFINGFKKYEGVTPGQYRSINKDKK